MKINRRSFLGAAAAAPALTRRLTRALDEVRLFDSHEHLVPEETRLAEKADFFALAGHYALNDVISAGLGGDALKTVRDERAPLRVRWQAFEPHWKSARFTGYGQALSLAVRDLYGVEEISGTTIQKIDDAVRSTARPGFYRSILRERAAIDWCLVDAYWAEKPARLSPDYFLLAQKFDGFVMASSRKDLARLEGVSGVSIQSFADHKKALEQTFENARKAGMVAVKSTLAYQRQLHFREIREQDAAREFEALLKGGAPPFRDLQDHMFHQIVRLAQAHRLPFQIHTGLLAGNRAMVEDTKPTHLNNIFGLYPNVNFDLFHIGYPYQEELGVLVKLFPNVYADFCWAHIISPPGSRRTLDEYLETVPVNKIIAFGGDYRFVELSYAHARMARRNVSEVLAGKVASGLFTEDQALEIGRLLLRENAMALFQTP